MDDIPYKLNDRILAKWGEFYYDAKIIAISGDGPYTMFTIHYNGWHKRYDQTYSLDQCSSFFMPFDEKKHQLFKAQLSAARKGLSLKKKKGKMDSRNSGEPSTRSTSPNGSAEDDKETRKGRGRKRKHVDDDAYGNPNSKEYSPGIPDEVKERTKVSLPVSLHQVLVDDSDMINRQFYIYSLPANFSVEKIVQEYIAHVAPDLDYEQNLKLAQDSSAAPTFFVNVTSLLYIFDSFLPKTLLYKQERPQYTRLIQQTSEAQDGHNSAAGDRGSTPRKKRSSVAKDKEERKENESHLKCCKFYGFPHLLRLLSRYDEYFSNAYNNAEDAEIGRQAVQDFIAYLEKNKSKFFRGEKDYKPVSTDYQREIFG